MHINFKGKVDPPVGQVMGPVLYTNRYYRVAGTIYNADTKMSEVYLDPVD